MPEKEKFIKSDLARIDAMGDADIDYSDIPELEESFHTKPVVHLPKAKSTVTIRLDLDVLEWFKSQGKGYQTRINALLRAYMEAHAKG